MSKNKQNLTIKCDSCKHSEVCRYKDEFEALAKKINEMFYEKAEPSPFDVEATCKHFSEPGAPYWPSGVKGIGEIWPNTTRLNDPCENCPSNPKYNPLGIQVGDTPCTFCRYRQPTVTYNDSNLTTTTTPKSLKNITATNTAVGE